MLVIQLQKYYLLNISFSFKGSIPGHLTNGNHEHADPFSPSPTTNGVLCQKSPAERLLALTNDSGASIVQRNGQRIYGGPPPDWSGPAPGKGCEIFCGKVPRDCFEDELVPIFQKVGKEGIGCGRYPFAAHIRFTGLPALRNTFCLLTITEM